MSGQIARHTIPMETCALCLSQRLDRLERQARPRWEWFEPPDPSPDIGVHIPVVEVATTQDDQDP